MKTFSIPCIRIERVSWNQISWTSPSKKAISVSTIDYHLKSAEFYHRYLKRKTVLFRIVLIEQWVLYQRRHEISILIGKLADWYLSKMTHTLLKGLIMDRCVLFTSTPLCVVSPRWEITRAQPERLPRGETTHKGVDVNNTHLSMINPDYNTNCLFIYQ